MTHDFIPENKPSANSNIELINDAVQGQELRTEEGDRILEIKIFDPNTNKGVYLVGENQHAISQCVVTTEKDGIKKDIEAFAKRIPNEQNAIIEQEAYRRCKTLGIPSLELLSGIPTPMGIFNLTKTENYLLPYSRLKILNIEQYNKLGINGFLALNRIHQAGIHHRDTLTRNIATLSNKYFLTFAFDFETANLLPFGESLNKTQREQDRSLFLESLFFQLLKQNPQNSNLIELAEKSNKQLSQQYI